MHFLHTDAQLAAKSLCVQDMQPALRRAVAALKYAHAKRQASGSRLYKWATASADNYCWLGLFAETLGRELSKNCGIVSRHHSAIYNLRVCVPTRLRRFGTVDSFPNLLKQTYPNAQSIVAAYRLDYISKRRNPKWGKTTPPGWYTRGAYQIL